MIIKSHLGKMVIWGAVCMAFLTQPAPAYVGVLGLPAVGTVALGTTAKTFWIPGHQKHNYDGVYSNNPPQKNVDVAPPDGATIMISSVPVVIQTQVSKNIFTVNIPNDKGGYSAVVIKKSGNGFVGPQGEFYPDFPKVSQLKIMYGK